MEENLGMYSQDFLTIVSAKRKRKYSWNMKDGSSKNYHKLLLLNTVSCFFTRAVYYTKKLTLVKTVDVSHPLIRLSIRGKGLKIILSPNPKAHRDIFLILQLATKNMSVVPENSNKTVGTIWCIQLWLWKSQG